MKDAVCDGYCPLFGDGTCDMGTVTGAGPVNGCACYRRHQRNNNSLAVHPDI